MDEFRQACFINLRADLEALVCKREAMVVANREREAQGQAPAYGEKDFNDLAQQMLCVLPDPHMYC